MHAQTLIPMTTAPSKLPVGDTPDADWSLLRQKGNRVRYMNNVTGVWDKAFSLEPGDALHRELDADLYAAPNSRLSDDLKPVLTVKASKDQEPASEPEKAAQVSPTIPLEEHTRDALRALCKEFGLSGYGKLNKAGLITLLHENGVLS